MRIEPIVLRTLLVLLFSVPVSTASELHDAARKGDQLRIVELLAGGANVNETDGTGATPLYEAAKRGKANVAEVLLAAGADPYITAKGPYGSAGSPIHVASKQGHTEIVRLVLDVGVDPNLPNSGTGPPLHLALRRGRAEVAELLKSVGARPITAEPISQILVDQDVKLGRQLRNGCQLCHDLSADRTTANFQGPALWGVVGRPEGSVRDFQYSDALAKAGGIWSYEDLNSFIANPRAFVPGTKMDTFAGISSPTRRAALILYLRTLSEELYPLP